MVSVEGEGMAEESMTSWFWDTEVWLPPGYTWESLAQAEHFEYPRFLDIWTYPFAIAAAFIILRYFILTPYVFIPFALRTGLTNNSARPPLPNATLEKVFRKYRTRVPAEVILEGAKKEGLSERQVERWLRQKAASTRTTDVGKFLDCIWQAFYYTFYTIFGVVVLWDKPWLWDIRHCWYTFPEQSIDNDVWWYYMVALGFYWCMTLTHFIQHHRKDSTQMFIHHVLTILLMTFSWTCNLVRCGTLVLLVHECTDIPMLIAKITSLYKRQDLMDKFFVVFLLLWLATRTGFYPLWIMRSTLFEAHVILNWMYPVYYIFNGMLVALLVIHCIWTYFILRIVIRKLGNQEVQDIRSSSDYSAEDDDSVELKKES
ncbi:ceramide synthase 6-like isoform X1 [Palaemon carinicauda]|uniref:ceramide synthase 6-like isoform X1 n=2 Tax=Palaemon carinicauda TaxID=392227 RepID=UPI0035B6A712